VDPADRLVRAAAIMRRTGVSAIAVVLEGELTGIITVADILDAVADGLSTDAIAVAQYMRAVPEVPRTGMADRTGGQTAGVTLTLAERAVQPLRAASHSVG
jgi:CBS domain-containing protein